MEFAKIIDTMHTAKDQDKRFVSLFGSETFRSSILYFRPGERTDRHGKRIVRRISRQTQREEKITVRTWGICPFCQEL